MSDRGGRGGGRGGGGEWRGQGGGSAGGRGRGGDRGGGGGGYRGDRGGGSRGGGGGGFRGDRGGGGSFSGDRGGGGGGFRGDRGGGGGGFRGDRGGGGGFRGDRGGGGRGFGGGGGRGRCLPPSFTKDALPSYSNNQMQQIDKEFGGTGWQPFNYKEKEDVILQTYKGPEAKEFEKKVSVSVNHFELKQFKLPDKIYHYEVNMERVKREKADEKPSGSSKPAPSKSPVGKGGRGRGKPQPGDSGPPGGGDGGAGSSQQQGPKKLPKPIPQLIMTVLVDSLRREMKNYGIVSDLSNNIYSMKKLEGNVQMSRVINMGQVDQIILQESDDGDIKVEIVPTNLEIDTLEMQQFLNNNRSWKGMQMDAAKKTTIEQVYNAIVKSMPRFRFLPVGRSLIQWPDNKDQNMLLGDNVICWKGIAANIAMGWRPYLCADIAHSAFHNDTRVLEALGERLNVDPTNINNFNDKQWEEGQSYLKNLKVKYDLPNSKTLGGPVTGFCDKSVSDETFPFGSQEITIRKYFKQQYNKDLQFANGLCLILRGRCKVPAELCVIKKGQSFSRKLNDIQTRNMLGLAKKDPRDLQDEIKRSINDITKGNNPVLDAWGVNLSNEMLRLDNTRVLEAPKLRYGTGTGANQGKGSAIISPSDGQWEIWNSEFNFLEPRDVKSWAILVAGNCRVDNRQIEDFVKQLVDNGKSKGVIFHQHQPSKIKLERLWDNSDTATAQQNVKQLVSEFQKFRDNGHTIVVVIIPKKNSAIYSHVKQAAEIHTGVLTQCVVGQNVYKGQAATVQNILLKINSKLGGVNYVPIPPPNKDHLKRINILRCPMLIIGADVTHPPPGTMKKVGKVDYPVPSYAAVTGSIDKTGMPFMMDIRAQAKAGRGAAEVIQNLDQIVHKMLVMFERKTNGLRPRKIIFYRDGVGEGQFPEVLHTEMLAMRRACNRLKDYDGHAYEPKITFITVQKRHKTRFFYHPNPNTTSNPLAGTVVDREIVHQTETDFYLCSHKGMMGTSRPTRYHVLWDDSNFTADEIQCMTYYLCYMYVRCSKSVKIPAPTYYAHWAAARAKALTDGLDDYFGNLPKLNEAMRRNNEFTTNFPMHFV